MADASPLVRHFLRRCRRDGNTHYLDVLGDNFDDIMKDRGGVVITSGGANGQSYTFGELQGFSSREIIAAKETAYGLFAQCSPAQVANYLDRAPSNRTVARFPTCAAYDPVVE